jgi:hypothetical protein
MQNCRVRQTHARTHYVNLYIRYDANAIILLVMTMFEVLNPIVQICAIEVVGFVARFGDSIEKVIYLVWVHLWKSHHVHLLLGNFPCLGGCLYPLLHVLIP